MYMLAVHIIEMGFNFISRVLVTILQNLTRVNPDRVSIEVKTKHKIIIPVNYCSKCRGGFLVAKV